jgi:Mg/Co/Ni transporter MgtE
MCFWGKTRDENPPLLCSFHPLSLSLSLSRYIEMIADLEDSSSALGGGDLLLSSSQPGSPTTTTGSNNNNTGDYRKESVLKILKARIGWLSAFFLGLILAAVVVERFEELLTHEVELSYFVPLLIGHGGNTGSQSVATVIRAIALKQIKPESGREVAQVLFKEAISGFVMGGFLGALVFVLSLVWEGISPLIGLVVAISLPLVSVWANVLGAGLPLFAVRMGFNPAVTSAPLMTTIVDSSGLVIYFLVAQRLMPETLGDVAVKIAAEAVGAGSDGSAT